MGVYSLRCAGAWFVKQQSALRVCELGASPKPVTGQTCRRRLLLQTTSRRRRSERVARRRSEPGGRFLYVLSGALTTYSIEESQKGAEKAPVPPCILPVEDGTSQVSLEVDDRRGPRRACDPRAGSCERVRGSAALYQTPGYVANEGCWPGPGTGGGRAPAALLAPGSGVRRAAACWVQMRTRSALSALMHGGAPRRADRPSVLKISADHVRISIKSGISSEGAGEEILVRLAGPRAAPAAARSRRKPVLRRCA